MNSYVFATPTFAARVPLRRRNKWLSGALLSLMSMLAMSMLAARAEASPPSQEFWNYMVEFGDAHGEVFDPTDFDAINHAQMPTAEVEATAAPHTTEATQHAIESEQQAIPIAPMTKESLR